ncbi:MAG: hypothetical protein V5A16_05610, partial [Haloplanus sp.]
MPRTGFSPALVVGLLLVALVAGAAPVAADETAPTTTIGTDSDLADSEAGVEFRETGNVSVAYAAPNVSIMATQEAEHCGVDRDGASGIFGVFSDTRNDYLCLEYGEDVTRQFEIYVSASVWAGYDREGVDAETGDAPAHFESVTINGSDYLRVTVTVDEPGTYAYPINRESAFVAERVDTYRDSAANITGVGAANSEWRYVNPEDYSNESTYVLQAPNGTDTLLLEYQDPVEGTWQVVPEGKQSYAPVYYEQVSETEILVFAAGT